jgi:large subunit ribosomal protein L30
MKKLRIKQVKSQIGRPLRQKKTLVALGITRMNKVKEVEASPQVLGMIDKVKHLLTVEEV